MGRKIFVSYKYNDTYVKSIRSRYFTRVRDYVNWFEDILDKEDHIYKGEEDNEDLSKLSEEVIWSKLKDRIYDSSITIVFISPKMKDPYKSDKDQWIPWEISYSLKEMSRKNKNGDSVTSRSNAMLGVVIPDPYNSYSYFIDDKHCCNGGCRLLKTDTLFRILNKNMFNNKNGNKYTCNNGDIIWRGNGSYIDVVKWKDFIVEPNKYINEAINRQTNIDDYEIEKNI